MSKNIDISQVKAAMIGKEEGFLSQYYGLDSSVFTKKQKACPSCGGTNRFAILKKHGVFKFACGWGSGSARGDVFDLAQHVSNESFMDVKKNAIEFLGIEGMSPEREREILKIQADAARKRKELALQEIKIKLGVANKARDMWHSLPVANPDHSYLKGKRMSKHASKFRQFKDVLVIPVFKNKRIVSLQFISDKKNFMKNSDVIAAYFIWGKITKDTKRVYIVEGVSTGFAVHEMTKGDVVFCTFTVKNLMSITKLIKEKLPKVELILAADNDIREKGDTNPNDGVETAKIVSKVTGCKVMIPTIKSKGKCDFHDVFMEHLNK
jgi:phage/plasmid primase-like uncharacterized protein